MNNSNKQQLTPISVVGGLCFLFIGIYFRYEPPPAVWCYTIFNYIYIVIFGVEFCRWKCPFYMFDRITKASFEFGVYFFHAFRIMHLNWNKWKMCNFSLASLGNMFWHHLTNVLIQYMRPQSSYNKHLIFNLC